MLTIATAMILGPRALRQGSEAYLPAVIFTTAALFLDALMVMAVLYLSNNPL